MSLSARRYFIVCLVLAFGCGRRPGFNGAQILRYPMIQEPGTMDPARIQDVYTDELLQNVYEGLITFDASNRVVPALSEKWEVSADGKTYTFHLRGSARFHNRRTVTSQDVKYSLERALWPDTRSPTAANYLSGIVGAADVATGKRKDLTGVAIPDSHTVVITIDRPRGYFLGALAYPTGWIVCEEAIRQNGRRLDEKAAIGTGPFKIEEYRHGSKVVLTANRDYWAGRPRLDRIERPIVIDPQTAHVMYESDQLDALPQAALSDFVNDQRNPALKAESHLLPQANLFYLVMHPRLQPAFADKRVRRAFAMAIDRDEVARLAYQGASPRADSFIPPGLLGATPNPPRIPYDPAGARRLLGQAGYPGGRGFPSVTLVFLEKQPEWNAMAQVIRDYLKKNLGITISLQEHEAASFWTDTSDQEKIPFFITGWVADYPDPQDFLSTLLRSGAKLNHVAYSNGRFDALCDRADAELDPKKRAPLYQEADRIAMEEVAVLPLVFYNQPTLIKPRVRDAEHNVMLFFLPHTKTRIQR